MNQSELETHLEIRDNEFAPDPVFPCDNCGKPSETGDDFCNRCNELYC